MPRRNNNPRRQNNNPQQQVPDPPTAPPKWGVIFKLSLFSIPNFYLIFFHYSIDSEFRRSIIINAGLSLASFFVTNRIKEKKAATMPRRNNNPRRQNNNPQQKVPDPPIASPKWGVIFKLSLFSIPYFYLIFFHYSIDSEFRRSIIINAGLSLAGFFVTNRIKEKKAAIMPRRNNNPRRQNNNPQQQVPDPSIAPPKWGVIFKLSLFSIPYFYLIFFHYSIDSEFRRSIIIIAGLSLAGFFVTNRIKEKKTATMPRRNNNPRRKKQ
ncbi:unnamed protein product [Trifolium pratense]|uniref:Uncharacterized protein n=1 Tax=Trifolium pratense TaxID=57577 RepID=A0ACB0L9I9_TRIPR|nr:unnamed protein product [Trifolium pratense]